MGKHPADYSDPYRDVPKGGVGGDNQGFWVVVFVALFAAVMWGADACSPEGDPQSPGVVEEDYYVP